MFRNEADFYVRLACVPSQTASPFGHSRAMSSRRLKFALCAQAVFGALLTRAPRAAYWIGVQASQGQPATRAAAWVDGSPLAFSQWWAGFAKAAQRNGARHAE